MNKADNGHKFTNAEQEELYTLIAEDKQWQAAIKRAMADAKVLALLNNFLNSETKTSRQSLELPCLGLTSS